MANGGRQLVLLFRADDREIVVRRHADDFGVEFLAPEASQMVMVPAPCTTCSLVTISPAASQMKPEPGPTWNFAGSPAPAITVTPTTDGDTRSNSSTVARSISASTPRGSKRVFEDAERP